MKKFNFKLKGLLQLREFEEQKKKIELGQIVKQIQILRDENEEVSAAIGIAYKSQEKMLKSNTEGRSVGFYPYYIAGRRAHIEYNENQIYSLQKRYQEKVEEMKKAMGDVKIIENLKDKQFAKFRKEVNRKEQENIEELYLMTNSRRTP